MSYSVNKTKYLLPAEVLHLNQVLTRDSGRNATLLWTLLHTGARATEVLNLKKSNLDPATKSVFITGLKGSNDRDIPVPGWLFKLLIAQPEGERVFPISFTRLTQIWRFYRPVPKKLHSLRHTFAIELYKRTRDLRLVQVALGHKNIQNTMVYSEYVYSTEELRRLIVPRGGKHARL